MISVIRPSNYIVKEEEAEESIIAGGSLVLNARCSQSEVLIFLNSLAFREHVPLSIQSLDFWQIYADSSNASF